MRSYLGDLWSEIWRSVITGYQALATPSIDIVEKKFCEDNEKAMYAILCGLLDSELEKIMYCESAKDI